MGNVTTSPEDLHDVAAEVGRLREAIEGAGRSELSVDLRPPTTP